MPKAACSGARPASRKSRSAAAGPAFGKVGGLSNAGYRNEPHAPHEQRSATSGDAADLKQTDRSLFALAGRKRSTSTKVKSCLYDMTAQRKAPVRQNTSIRHRTFFRQVITPN